MNKTTKKRYLKMFGSKVGKAVMALSLLAPVQIFSQVTYSFTNCGATGQNGPNQAAITSAYALTNLAGLVTATTQGVQQWTVPTTGPYRITAYGAQGGVSWGLGASMSGDFVLTAGQVLKIVVGQAGGSQNNSHGSGGGGSFVSSASNVPMLVAGGGGGRGASSGVVQAYSHGDIGTSGGSPPGGGPGGTGGGGGAAANSAVGGTSLTPGGGSNSSTWASGGGGFYTDGGMYNNNSSFGGRAFLNNALGGDAGTGAQTQGGFGGGGGAGDRGAGGGGYSGGGGGTSNSDGGGGGGSYNTGTNQVNLAGVRSGHGMVTITTLCNVGINGPTTICSGKSTTLTTTAASNINWSTGSTAPTVILSPLSTTFYTLTGNGTIPPNCSVSLVFAINVNPLPTVAAIVNPPLLCVGSTATLTGVGATSYTWSTGPSGTMTTVSPVVSTSYSVVGTGTNGCTNSATFNVDVDALALTITGNTTVCEGKSTQLTGSGGTSLNWVGGGPFNPITVTPTGLTVYTLTGIDPNNCPLTQTVAVGTTPNPTVTATTANTVVCKGSPVTLNAGGADSYSWTGMGNTAAITVTPALEIPYTYTVTGTNASGCEGKAYITLNVKVCTGINEVSASRLPVSIYPNPTNGAFTIELSNGLNKAIEVVDVTGRVVLSNNTDNNLTEVNISALANGVYYVKITSEGITETLKVVKH